jgi:hypothetical protein
MSPPESQSGNVKGGHPAEALNGWCHDAAATVVVVGRVAVHGVVVVIVVEALRQADGRTAGLLNKKVILETIGSNPVGVKFFTFGK